MKHTLYASKPLKFDAVNVAAGDILATIETDFPLDRVLAGLSNGAATLNAPAPKEPHPEEAAVATAADAAPAPTPPAST